MEGHSVGQQVYRTCAAWVVGLLLCQTVVLSSDLACSNVKYAYTAKGFDVTDVPVEAISGEHLLICERGMTCCTKEMERKLSTQSRAEFDRLLKETISQIRTTFASHAQKFDEFFRELLKTSKKDFHDMFLRTYGMLYDTNSFIFHDMFQDLEKYYVTGGVDLTEAMDSFFHRLYQKMFQVLNTQYSFDGEYLNCISEHMEEMKPFGDVPKKLTLEVKRSFIATRTFLQALAVGRDVAKNLMEVGPTPECSRALMKMTYCPHCQGLPDLKPCSDYCMNVMKGCLSYHAELDTEWNSYIDALLLLANRLESSFNIESVVDPIDIKISDAIMNFQEHGYAVSQKLFERCGTPRLGKREARTELKFETLKFGYRANVVRPTTAAGTSLERLVEGIKKKVRRSKGFWNRLSNVMCTHPQVLGTSDNDDNNCWNGLGPAKHEVKLQDDGSVNQHDPEMSLDVSRHNSVVSQQLLALKLITTKLNHAYNGLDVEWQDSDADWVGSGSGSGSGYGEVEQSVTDGFGDIYFSISTPTPSSPHHPSATLPKVKMPGSSANVAAHPTLLLLAALFLLQVGNNLWRSGSVLLLQ